MAWIALVQGTDSLEARIAAHIGTPGLSDLVAWAAGDGFSFNEDELRRAFVLDWRMRRLRYAGQSRR